MQNEMQITETNIGRPTIDVAFEKERPALSGREAKKPTGGVRVKSVALPTEHGGWGLSLEPVLLGLIVAPSLAGIGLMIAAVGAFLARQPLKILAADRRHGKRFARTPVAERFLLLYASIAALGFALALLTAKQNFLLPLIIAAPLALVQLVYDSLGRSRALAPELAGGCAMASVAAAAAIAGGWSAAPAFGLWTILALRVAPTVIYIRARLQKMHGKDVSMPFALYINALAACIAFALAYFKIIPFLSAAILALLFVRAAFGLYFPREGATPKRIGFAELAYGCALVIATALGYFFSL